MREPPTRLQGQWLHRPKETIFVERRRLKHSPDGQPQDLGLTLSPYNQRLQPVRSASPPATEVNDMVKARACLAVN